MTIIQTITIFRCTWPRCNMLDTSLEVTERHVRQHLGFKHCAEESPGEEEFYYEEHEVSEAAYLAAKFQQQRSLQQQGAAAAAAASSASNHRLPLSPSHNSDGLSSGHSFASSSPATSPVCSTDSSSSSSSSSSSASSTSSYVARTLDWNHFLADHHNQLLGTSTGSPADGGKWLPSNVSFIGNGAHTPATGTHLSPAPRGRPRKKQQPAALTPPPVLQPAPRQSSMDALSAVMAGGGVGGGVGGRRKSRGDASADVEMPKLEPVGAPLANNGATNAGQLQFSMQLDTGGCARGESLARAAGAICGPRAASRQHTRKYQRCGSGSANGLRQKQETNDIQPKNHSNHQLNEQQQQHKRVVNNQQKHHLAKRQSNDRSDHTYNSPATAAASGSTGAGAGKQQKRQYNKTGIYAGKAAANRKQARASYLSSAGAAGNVTRAGADGHQYHHQLKHNSSQQFFHNQSTSSHQQQQQHQLLNNHSKTGNNHDITRISSSNNNNRNGINDDDDDDDDSDTAAATTQTIRGNNDSGNYSNNINNVSNLNNVRLLAAAAAAANGASVADGALSGRRGVRNENRKCRKVYGMEKRDLWCTQCKWKKACSRFSES